MSQVLRFFRTNQDPGDPRRADVHIGFERIEAGGRLQGHAATVHPEFASLIAAATALLAACELALPVLRDQHAALAPVLHGGICPDREAMFAIEAAIAAAKGVTP